MLLFQINEGKRKHSIRASSMARSYTALTVMRAGSLGEAKPFATTVTAESEGA